MRLTKKTVRLAIKAIKVMNELNIFFNIQNREQYEKAISQLEWLLDNPKVIEEYTLEIN